MIDDSDRKYLERCVELASDAVAAGNEPFGSVLVSRDGTVLFEAFNEVGGGDATRHPEFAIARWAAERMTPGDRSEATVYTSGEHCPMCAAAHAWVGLGRIVFASSAAQLVQWQAELGATPSRFDRFRSTTSLRRCRWTVRWRTWRVACATFTAGRMRCRGRLRDDLTRRGSLRLSVGGRARPSHPSAPPGRGRRGRDLFVSRLCGFRGRPPRLSPQSTRVPVSLPMRGTPDAFIGGGGAGRVVAGTPALPEAAARIAGIGAMSSWGGGGGARRHPWEQGRPWAPGLPGRRQGGQPDGEAPWARRLADHFGVP